MIRDRVQAQDLDRNVYIHHTAVVYPGVTIEDGVTIGPFCVIGAPAQINKDWHTKPVGRVIIRTGTILHGLNKIDSGFEGVTEIGANCFIMSQNHIGHDCVIENNVEISPMVSIAGHCTIGAYSVLGMGAMIHQFSAIPKKCMVGMGAVITRKAAEMMQAVETWAGNPAKKISENKRWVKK